MVDQSAGQPGASFADMPSLIPKREQRANQPQTRFAVFNLSQAPFQRRSQIVVLGLKLIEPLDLLRATDLCLSPLSPLQEEI